jgi:hypothetical protein
VALQVWLSAWEISWPIKVLVINAIAIFLLLTTYHWCIRFSWIGAWLNGRRAKRSKNVPALSCTAPFLACPITICAHVSSSLPLPRSWKTDRQVRRLPSFGIGTCRCRVS